MREEDFLERLKIAQTIWEKQGHSSKDVNDFISWVFKEYGFLEQPK